MRRFVPVCVLLLACQAEEVEGWDAFAGPSELVEAGDVTGIRVVEVSGTAPLSVPVYAVNDLGASVPSDPLQISIDGTLQAVSFDPRGVGEVTFESAGHHTIESDGTVWQIAVFDTPDPVFDLSRHTPGPEADRVMGLTGGALVLSGNSLYYGNPELGSMEVFRAAAGEDLIDARAVDIDLDGIRDVLTWSSSGVYLLRGLEGGGLAWGTGFTSSDRTLNAAAVADLNQDGVPDLLLAWSNLDGSELEPLVGDSQWSFESRAPVSLASSAESIAVADNVNLGEVQITVIEENLLWERFIVSSQGVVPTGPIAPFEFPANSRIDAPGDFNGDEGVELVVASPRVEGESREILVMDLLGSTIEYLSRTPTSAYLDYADGNGDGMMNLFTLSEVEGEPSISMLYLSEGQWRQSQRAFPVLAPFGAGEWTGDGVPDLLVVDDTWWWSEGQRTSESTLPWSTADYATPRLLGDASHLSVGDTDDDLETTEFAALDYVAPVTWLKLWSVDAAGALTIVERVSLSSNDTLPRASARCGDMLAAQVGDELIAVDTRAVAAGASAGSLPRLSGFEGVALACDDNRIAALVDSEAGREVVIFNWSLGSALTRTDAPDAVDLAFDENGEIVTCDTMGCQVLKAGASVATLTDALSIDEQLLEMQGHVRAADVDGDGQIDLLGGNEDGWLFFSRGTGEGFGPVQVYDAGLAIGEAPVPIDVGQDGVPDLVIASPDGRVSLVRGALPQ